ncbi:MAG: CPBP family intramembrane glutamic endopeptidase, partial [Pyrinomonadaceae bacterium]
GLQRRGARHCAGVDDGGRERALTSADERAPRAADATEVRTLAAWEIASVVSSVLIAEWAVTSLAEGSKLIGAVPTALAFIYVIVSHRLHGESAREIGWQFENFPRAARLLLLPTLVPAIVLIIAGWYVSSLNFKRWGGGHLFFGVLPFGVMWGLLQQYILQGFVNRRAVLIWGRGWRSILFVAIIFAALHLPNPWLTSVTFAGGLVWAAVYQRAPNLFALGLSHALMTWVLVSTVPPSALHSLRVGFNYFR